MIKKTIHKINAESKCKSERVANTMNLFGSIQRGLSHSLTIHRNSNNWGVYPLEHLFKTCTAHNNVRIWCKMIFNLQVLRYGLTDPKLWEWRLELRCKYLERQLAAEAVVVKRCFEVFVFINIEGMYGLLNPFFCLLRKGVITFDNLSAPSQRMSFGLINFY